MAKRKKYGSYDPWIKATVAATGNINLFPDLNIPRMTALHWIKEGYKIDDPTLESMTAAIIQSQGAQENLKLQLQEAKASTKLLKDVAEVLGYKLRWKHIDETKVRDKILDAISIAMTTARRDFCLETLDLSLSRYKRWRREKSGCGLPDIKVCPKGNRLNQLTFQEIQVMRNLVTSKEYAHFPIRSLQYFSKRNGLLYCTYSTWRKYINQYGWKRVRKRRIKKRNEWAFEPNV